jgi:hypothetical protein
MTHKISDFDPNRGLHDKLADLKESNDKMLGHLATIAGAVKSDASPSSPASKDEAEKTG